MKKKKTTAPDISQLDKLIEEKNAGKIMSMALAYENGLGVKKDIREALLLYKEAYALGDNRAAYYVGLIYYDETNGNVETNKTEAAKWFKLSADAGIKESALCLAEMYSAGDGVEQNDETAANYYLAGADEDITGEAAYALGMMFFEGRGVPENKQKGIMWLEKSAEKKVIPDAAAELGRIYKEGDGVQKDLHMSRIWYNRAAKSALSFENPSVLFKSTHGRMKIFLFVLFLFVFAVAGTLISYYLTKNYLIAIPYKKRTLFAAAAGICGLYLVFRKSTAASIIGFVLMYLSYVTTPYLSLP